MKRKTLTLLISIVMSSSIYAATQQSSQEDDGKQLYEYLYPDETIQHHKDTLQSSEKHSESKKDVTKWVDRMQGAFGKPRSADEYVDEPKKKGDIVTNKGESSPKKHHTQDGKKNSNALDELIEKVANGRVSTKLINSIIQVSSQYDIEFQKNGRLGLMGIDKNWLTKGKDAFDPETNIEAGTQRIVALLSKYQDIRLALAAYDASETKIDKFGGIPNDSDTQTFVNAVLKTLSD